MMHKMTKQDKYEINQRNGFYMWAYNSSINTVQNIQLVKDHKIWVPMYDEVRLKPCPKPPLKNFVLKAVEAALQEKEEWRLQTISDIEQGIIESSDEIQKAIKRPYELNMTSNHQPDIEWLLVVLSTLNSNHKYFGKSYYPSDVELGGRGAKVRHEDADYDQFFEDLPEHLSKAKYSKKVGAQDRFSQSGAESQIPMSGVSQQNRDKQEIAELKRQVQELQGQNQKNGFRNFSNQNNSLNQNGINNGFSQSQFGQSGYLNSKRNNQQQNDKNMDSSNDATFGQPQFNSIYGRQNENQRFNKTQQNHDTFSGYAASKKEIAIKNVLSQNPLQTKKIFPTILSLGSQSNNMQFNNDGNAVSFINQNDVKEQQDQQVSSKIFQTGSKITKQFYAQEKTPWQTNQETIDSSTAAACLMQTAGIYEGQSNSVQVTPTKIKMSKVQFIYHDNAEGGNIRQISQSEVKENQAPNIKDNFMMNNIIVQSANGESSNQVDLNSLNRMLASYPQHLQQNLNLDQHNQ